MTRLLASLGLASTSEQGSRAPVLALLLLLGGAYYASTLVQGSAMLIERFLPGWSVYLRVPGMICSLLVAHGLIRAVVYRDEHSWGGWLRRQIL